MKQNDPLLNRSLSWWLLPFFFFFLPPVIQSEPGDVYDVIDYLDSLPPPIDGWHHQRYIWPNKAEVALWLPAPPEEGAAAGSATTTSGWEGVGRRQNGGGGVQEAEMDAMKRLLRLMDGVKDDNQDGDEENEEEEEEEDDLRRLYRENAEAFQREHPEWKDEKRVGPFGPLGLFSQNMEFLRRRQKQQQQRRRLGATDPSYGYPRIRPMSIKNKDNNNSKEVDEEAMVSGSGSKRNVFLSRSWAPSAIDLESTLLKPRNIKTTTTTTTAASLQKAAVPPPPPLPSLPPPSPFPPPSAQALSSSSSSSSTGRRRSHNNSNHQLFLNTFGFTSNHWGPLGKRAKRHLVDNALLRTTTKKRRGFVPETPTSFPKPRPQLLPRHHNPPRVPREGSRDLTSREHVAATRGRRL